MSLNSLEKKIKINFKNKKMLALAFIHKSSDSNYNNEKLEFLGDRILGFVIAKKLLEIYPNDSEGSLDKKLASLVNKQMCLKPYDFYHAFYNVFWSQLRHFETDFKKSN